MQRIHLIISGDVQGVGFRSWALHQAQAKRLTGWVKNRADGCVEITAEGSREKLDEFIGLCRAGPDTAWVKDIAVDRTPATNEFKGFMVVY
jgi:acylphosphatase